MSNCTKLTTLNGHIFRESAISSIQLPNSITTISAYSFYLCSNLNKINFPTQLTNFGSYAFYGCKTLQEVNLSNTQVTTIPTSTFSQCHILKCVILPQSLTAINENSFRECYKLQNVNLEDTSILSIGALAFGYDYSLTKVIIPVSVTSMDSTAFKDCCHLHEVWNLSPNVTIVAGGSDSGYYVRKVYTTMCKSELITLNNVVYLKKSETSYAVLRKADDSITHIKLHKYTTEIIQHAFYSEVGDLVSVDFSDCVNLTHIRPYAFYNNDSLTKLDLSNCKKLIELGGASFSACDSLVEVILNDGLEILASQVFEDCDNLATINIPSSVNRVGMYMFRACPKLTSLTFDTSLTWYKTQNHTDFSNRVNGTQVSLGTPSENATNFTIDENYYNWFWFVV